MNVLHALQVTTVTQSVSQTTLSSPAPSATTAKRRQRELLLRSARLASISLTKPKRRLMTASNVPLVITAKKQLITPKLAMLDISAHQDPKSSMLVLQAPIARPCQRNLSIVLRASIVQATEQTSMPSARMALSAVSRPDSLRVVQQDTSALVIHRMST